MCPDESEKDLEINEEEADEVSGGVRRRAAVETDAVQFEKLDESSEDERRRIL